MSLVRLRVLGRPEVEHADQLVHFRTRKTLALLLYLVLEGGRPSRSQLASLLWSESDEDHGRMALRGALMHLRTALQEPSSSPSVDLSAHLLSEGTTLHFVTTHDLDLDLLTVQQAWQNARTLERRRSPLSPVETERMLDSLQQATDLVRGPLCDQFRLPDAPSFEEWLGSQRITWQLRLHVIYDQLARLFEERGDLEQTQQTLLRWSSFDPLHEEAVRRLMQVQQAQGDRIAVLTTFEHFRRRLWQDLHARPSADLTSLVKQLKASPAPTSSQKVQPALTPPALARLEVPLVGREAEFRVLSICYRRTCQAESQVVVIQGEAGIGKTRLAADFRLWAQAQGAGVLRGQGFESGGRLPYLPIIELLRRKMEQERAPDDLVEDLWLCELSRLLPELRERYPDLPAPTMDPTAGQAHLFEAVARVLRAWAQRMPLVLWLDDLQWIDTATLDLLSYLLHSWSREPASILLLLCVRSEELTTTPELTSWLNSCQRVLLLQRLSLTSLSAQAIQTLISRLQGQIDLAPQTRQPEENQQTRLGHWLYRETGGQPFYLLETLKSLLNQGILAWQLDEESRWLLELPQTATGEDEVFPQGLLPQSVRELILQRVGRLSMAGQRLLQAGAILGQQFRFAPLCQVAELSEQEGLEALEEAMRSQLVREVGLSQAQGSIAYSLTHDKLRDAIYQEAGYARRKRLHHQALHALEGSDASMADRAYHALQAEQWEKAIRYKIQAGDEAMTIFVVHDAINCYEQARQIVESKYVHSDTSLLISREHLYDHLGQAYEFVNAWQQARESYESLLKCARVLHEPVAECLALNRLAMLLSQHSHNLKEILGLLHEALQVARQSGNKGGEQQTIRNLRRLQSQHLDDRKDSLSLFTSTLQASGTTNGDLLSDVMKQVTSEMDRDELLVDSWKGKFDMFDALRVAYATHGNQNLEALLRGGRIEEAREDVRRFGEQIGSNRRYRIPYLRALATLAQFDGQREQAITVLCEAAQLAQQTGLPAEHWSIQAALGRLYQQGGEDEQSRIAFVHAATLIHELAGKIQDQELRRSFVEAPFVQDVLRLVE